MGLAVKKTENASQAGKKSDPAREKRSSAGFSVTVRIQIHNRPGGFAAVAQRVAEAGGSLAEVALLSSDFDFNVRELTINCQSDVHSQAIISALQSMSSVTVLRWQDDTFTLHEGGKLSIVPTAEIENADQLSRAYTPGVARVCTAIQHKPGLALDYTIKGNCVAVVTDGSAVLGLGDIGPLGALPVMEGKAMLFKQFAGIDAFPICLDTKDTEEIIRTVKLISPVFAGINLEDISAPRCFEIERRLQEELKIPVFHDDQHGTAVVVLAGLINAAKIVNKKFADLKVVVNGFGASGVACTKMLISAGIKNIVPCDSIGVIYQGRAEGMNSEKEEMLKIVNPDNVKGKLADAIKGADVFLGVSRPGSLSREMVQTMAKGPIVFALANPVPEIMPEEISDIAAVIATGRSDYYNQVNNSLCFPGLFRGALDARATRITQGMKLAAAEAIAECVTPDQLGPNCIIPGMFKMEVASIVSSRVREAAVRDGVAETR